MALDILKAGAAYSFVMDAKGEKMVRRDFSPQARLSQHLEDVRLIRQDWQGHPWTCHSGEAWLPPAPASLPVQGGG